MVFNIKQNKIVRENNFKKIVTRQVNSYIKNGCKGDLDFSFLPINELPKNLKNVGGNLKISFTAISSLPSKLNIQGKLYMVNTEIDELPEDITIADGIWCWDSPISTKYSRIELKNKFNIKGNEIWI